MKSTFVIETRIRGRATTIKIHSIRLSPPWLISFIFHPRPRFEGCVFAHHANVLPPPLKCLDRGKPGVERKMVWNERERNRVTFSRATSFYITGKLESKRRP